MLEERQASSLGTSFMSGITAATPLVWGHCRSLLPVEVLGREGIGRAGCGWQGLAS